MNIEASIYITGPRLPIREFPKARKTPLAILKGRQQANANWVVAGWNCEKPKDFTEFSIDTQNLGA